MLLRNHASLGASERVRLEDVLQANQPLMAAVARTCALDSGIEALQRFALLLRPYWRCILSRVHWPMHTGQLEGINNRIKIIKRIAYGYRDTDHFFLKIRTSFPGHP